MAQRFTLGGLRPRLIASVILPFTVVFLGLAVAGFQIHGRAMRGLVAERDERAVRAASEAISAELIHRMLSVRDLGLRVGDGVPARRVIAESSPIRLNYPQGLAIVTVSPQRVVAGDISDQILRSKAVIDALAAPVAETVLRDVPTSNGAVAVAVFPGKPLAVIGAFSLLDLLRSGLPWLETPGSSASAVIVDSSIGLIARIGVPLERNYAGHPGVKAALGGSTGSLFLSPRAGEEHVLVFSPIQPPGWALLIEEPWQSVESPLLRLSLLAPLALIPILLISLAGLWFAARQVVSPLRELQGRATRLAAGDFDAVEEEIRGVREIRDLHHTMIQMARRIRSSQQSLRRYVTRVTSIQEEERRRLARDLHDETIQDLIALDQKVQLTASHLRSRKSDSRSLLETIHRDAKEAIQRVRRLSLALRPGYLEDLGLLPALEALVNDVSAQAEIPINLSVEGPSQRMSPEIDLVLYRIAQESLANITRHAKAHHAWITLRFTRSELRVTVRDDGVGFPSTADVGDLTKAGHFGLVGMRERAQSIGAVLDVRSKPGNGTRMMLRLPLR